MGLSIRTRRRRERKMKKTTTKLSLAGLAKVAGHTVSLDDTRPAVLLRGARAALGAAGETSVRGQGVRAVGAEQRISRVCSSQQRE